MRIQSYFNTNERLLVADLKMKHKKRAGCTKTRSPEGKQNLSDFSNTQAHL